MAVARHAVLLALLLPTGACAFVEAAMCLLNVTQAGMRFFNCSQQAQWDVHRQCDCLDAFNRSERVDSCRDNFATKLQIQGVNSIAAKCRIIARGITCAEEVTEAVSNYSACMSNADMQPSECACMGDLIVTLGECMSPTAAEETVRRIAGATESDKCLGVAKALVCSKYVTLATARYPVCFVKAANEHEECACLDEANATLGTCAEDPVIQMAMGLVLGDASSKCNVITCQHHVGQALLKYEAGVTGNLTAGGNCTLYKNFLADAGPCAGIAEVQDAIKEAGVVQPPNCVLEPRLAQYLPPLPPVLAKPPVQAKPVQADDLPTQRPSASEETVSGARPPSAGHALVAVLALLAGRRVMEAEK